MIRFIFLLLILFPALFFAGGPALAQRQYEGAPVSLRFNGIYSMLDTSMLPCGIKATSYYTALCYSVFGADGIAFQVRGACIDDGFKDCAYYKRYIKREKLGHYLIKGDSVYATMPVTVVLRGMRYRTRTAHFRGFVKCADTILDWKMVPPYPVRLSKFFREENDVHVQPQTLFFIPTDAVFCIDREG